jgi:hypothetical protein
MDVLKTAVKELKHGTRLDDDMFVELEMMLFSMRESDERSSVKNKGRFSRMIIYFFII